MIWKVLVEDFLTNKHKKRQTKTIILFSEISTEFWQNLDFFVLFLILEKRYLNVETLKIRIFIIKVQHTTSCK
jgi:hypothetical protein